MKLSGREGNTIKIELKKIKLSLLTFFEFLDSLRSQNVGFLVSLGKVSGDFHGACMIVQAVLFVQLMIIRFGSKIRIGVGMVLAHVGIRLILIWRDLATRALLLHVWVLLYLLGGVGLENIDLGGIIFFSWGFVNQSPNSLFRINFRLILSKLLVWLLLLVCCDKVRQLGLTWEHVLLALLVLELGLLLLSLLILQLWTFVLCSNHQIVNMFINIFKSSHDRNGVWVIQ